MQEIVDSRNVISVSSSSHSCIYLRRLRARILVWRVWFWRTSSSYCWLSCRCVDTRSLLFKLFDDYKDFFSLVEKQIFLLQMSRLINSCEFVHRGQAIDNKGRKIKRNACRTKFLSELLIKSLIFRKLISFLIIILYERSQNVRLYLSDVWM